MALCGGFPKAAVLIGSLRDVEEIGAKGCTAEIQAASTFKLLWFLFDLLEVPGFL